MSLPFVVQRFAQLRLNSKRFGKEFSRPKIGRRQQAQTHDERRDPRSFCSGARRYAVRWRYVQLTSRGTFQVVRAQGSGQCLSNSFFLKRPSEGEIAIAAGRRPWKPL